MSDYSIFCCCSVAQSCPTLCDPWTTAHQASLFITNSCPSSQWCHPIISSSVVSSSCPQSFPVQGLFQWVSSSHQVAQYWSFSFSISPLNEYLVLIYFRIDWFDLITVQEILKSLLQHHSSKASILWRLTFHMVQLSHQYMTPGKSIAVTI